MSLYLVAAGLAVDCVRQAQPAMVHALVDCLGEFVRKTLATWLRRRGGWVSGVWECWGGRRGEGWAAGCRTHPAARPVLTCLPHNSSLEPCPAGVWGADSAPESKGPSAALLPCWSST